MAVPKCLLLLVACVLASVQRSQGCSSTPCPGAGAGTGTTWERNAREQIQIDEGTRRCVYRDSLGILTAGIGHRVIFSDSDLINLTPNVDPISCDVILRYYRSDFDTAVTDARHLANIEGNFETLPDTAKEILVNMAFQLGRNTLSDFARMFRAIADGDYDRAADEMVDSLWYDQSGDRSRRLVRRMRGV